VDYIIRGASLMLRKISVITAWTLTALWMAVIFWFSHQPSTQSSAISGGLLETMIAPLTALGLGVGELDFLHTLLRKSAHFIAYAVLGLLSVHALRETGVKKSPFWAFLISFIYAITDEVHQLFIPGRSGEVSDVMIDTAGALIGIGIYHALLFLVRRKKEKGQSRK
jgi:VanZ family protein